MTTAVVDLQKLEILYGEGQYLKAYDLGTSWFGPPSHWPGTAGLIIAGRLAANLGGRRLSHGLHYRAWRRDPSDLQAQYYHLWTVLMRRGLFAAWELQQQFEISGASQEFQADWYAFRGRLCVLMRDFEAADEWWAKSEAIGSQRPWPWIERSRMLESEDRLPEALAAAQQALTLRPWMRPAVQATAHLLENLNRDDEALTLLSEAAARLQSGDVWGQLAGLQTELGQYQEAWASLERCREFYPLIEKDIKPVAGMSARRHSLSLRKGAIGGRAVG